MPPGPAARIGDMVTCPLATPVGPAVVAHVGSPLVGAPPVPPVLIGGQPAATAKMVQNLCLGPAPIPNPFNVGSMTVMIGGNPALRAFDLGTHGGSFISAGCPTVIIGG